MIALFEIDLQSVHPDYTVLVAPGVMTRHAQNTTSYVRYVSLLFFIESKKQCKKCQYVLQAYYSRIQVLEVSIQVLEELLRSIVAQKFKCQFKAL